MGLITGSVFFERQSEEVCKIVLNCAQRNLVLVISGNAEGMLSTEWGIIIAL